MELEGYSRPTNNKLVHSATTRSTVVCVIHKLTVDEFVDNTCGEIYVEITHVTLTTPLLGMPFHRQLWSTYVPNLKSLGAPVTTL